MLTKKAFRISFLVVCILGALALIWFVRSGLYPFIIAFFLAYLLNPIVCYLESKGLHRLWSILITYAVVLSIAVSGITYLAPLLIQELEVFGNQIPDMVAKVEELIQAFHNSYQSSVLPFTLRAALDNALTSLAESSQNFVISIVEGIIALVSHTIGIMISPVLAFYLLYDWNNIKKKLVMSMPGQWRHEILVVFNDVDKVLSGVIRGQIMIACLVGTGVSVGLYLLGVKFAFLIGIFAGLLDVIPYFGAIIGAVPAVTLALLDSTWLAAEVAGLFLVVHQTEGTIISPKIIGNSAGLHPLSVIFFLIVGEQFGGLIGMLLGVPIAAIAKVIIIHIYRLLI